MLFYCTFLLLTCLPVCMFDININKFKNQVILVSKISMFEKQYLDLVHKMNSLFCFVFLSHALCLKLSLSVSLSLFSQSLSLTHTQRELVGSAPVVFCSQERMCILFTERGDMDRQLLLLHQRLAILLVPPSSSLWQTTVSIIPTRTNLSVDC